MVGSPNNVTMVYDADESTYPATDTGIAIPPGSTAIEDLFESYYTYVAEPYDDTAFDGRSDYQAFIDHGIPAGGLFSGAEEVKTELQAGLWGGTPGQPPDPGHPAACGPSGNGGGAVLGRKPAPAALPMATHPLSPGP